MRPEEFVSFSYESVPRAWERLGSQNIVVSHHRREQLLRDKGVVDFEQMYCSAVDLAELDAALLAEFRRGGRGPVFSLHRRPERAHHCGWPASPKSDAGRAGLARRCRPARQGS